MVAAEGVEAVLIKNFLILRELVLLVLGVLVRAKVLLKPLPPWGVRVLVLVVGVRERSRCRAGSIEEGIFSVELLWVGLDRGAVIVGEDLGVDSIGAANMTEKNAYGMQFGRSME